MLAALKLAPGELERLDSVETSEMNDAMRAGQVSIDEGGRGRQRFLRWTESFVPIRTDSKIYCFLSLRVDSVEK